MNYKKNNYKPVCITGAVLLAIGIGFLVGGLITDTGWMLFVTIISVLSGLIVLVVGLTNMLTDKKAGSNIDNPRSFAHRTYGGNENYDYFSVLLDRKGQAARNVAVNALGIAGMIFGGGGVFVSGTTAHDIFVNEKELVLNNPSANKKLDDSKFGVIPADCVSDVRFETEKKYEHVIVVYDDGALSFDVRISSPNDIQKVRNSFSRLLTKKTDGDVFEGYCESPKNE